MKKADRGNKEHLRAIDQGSHIAPLQTQNDVFFGWSAIKVF